MTEPGPLKDATTVSGQVIALGIGLDPFDHDARTEALGQRDKTIGDPIIAGVTGQGLADEGSRDLPLIRWRPLRIGPRATADTERVERDPDAERSSFGDLEQGVR
ncbi:hypothetical protein ABC977_04150 [Thioalkalicoccus limnaeus]|uniref:Uncharacterized protein n=1 Tax=Thioalkalicoccus limnaeus TaxID=120681 RepID=A0ABV4BB64_9GAMM